MNLRFFDLVITQIWQIAALAIFVAVIVRLVAKNRPHLAHAMWMLVLIKCVTPPLWGHSLGVFSQLQATFGHDESAVLPTAPETNVTPANATVIELSTPPMELSAADDRLLEFDEQEDLVFDSEAGSPLEVVTFDDNDAVESDETLSAIAAASIDSSKPAADDIDYRSMLMFLLCTGAITTLFVMIFRCRRCLRLIHHHRTTEFDESLSFRIQQLSKQLRIRRAPQIIVSNVLFGPAVLGLLRHTIVLPRCLFEIMEGSNSYAVPSPLRSGEKVADRPDEGSAPVSTSIDVQLQFLDPILAHELIHIRRGDLRTGTLQAIVQSLWWFHPAVWFANRWLSREAERCCDEQVIAELGCTPGHYARSLLSVIESKHRLQPIPVFPGMRPVEITAQRMERIMSLKNGLKKRTPLWCWLMIAALAFVVLPGAVARPSVDEAKPELLLTSAECIKEPLTASVRLDDNFVLSQDVPVMGNTIVAYVNSKPITVDSLVADSSTALLLKHLPEMEESDRRRIVTNAIENSLPLYVYEELVLQHSGANLSAGQQAQLTTAQEKRDVEVLAKLPEIIEQSKKLESQADLLATAFQQYKTRDQAANGDLSRLSRDARVARYVKEAPDTDVLCERDATLLHCRNLLLQARLRSDVSLSFSNTSLREVLRSIATDHGLNIAVQTRLVETPATVTFHCENQPLDDALKAIVEPFGFCVRVDQEIVMIGSAATRKSLANGDGLDSGSSREVAPQLSTALPTKTRCNVADLILKLSMEEEVDRTEAASMVKFMVGEAMNEAQPLAVNATTVVIENDELIVHHPQNMATRLEKILHQIRTNGFAESELQLWFAIIPEGDSVELLKQFAMQNVDATVVSGTTYTRTDGTAEQVNKMVFQPFQPIEFCALDMRRERELKNMITENRKSTKFSCRDSVRVLNGETISMKQYLYAVDTNLDAELPGRLLDLTVFPLNSRLVQLNMTIHADDESGSWTCQAVDNRVYVFRGPTRIKPTGERDSVLFAVSTRMHGKPKAGAKSGGENLYATNVNRSDFATRLVQIPGRSLPDWISKPSSGLLVKLIWDARAAAQRRLLMTDQRTPWQFMNGLAALRRDFLVRDGDEAVTALDWLWNCKSFPGQPWFEKTEFGGQPNPTPAPLWFDGHAEQFVATLAMNDVPLDAKFATADGTITMGDMIRHLQMTVNPKSIPPWTLIALTKYLPPDAEWVKPDGERWDVEKVVKHFVDSPSGTMSTTSLAALVFARDQYLRTGRPVQGVWLEAQDRIADAIHRTQARAIAPGEIRPLYQPRPFPHWKPYPRSGSPPFSESPEDRELMAGNFGHSQKVFESGLLRTQRETLQFLTSTLTDDQLREDWFRLQIEAAANELIGDWSNKEIQSPFYETTQALTTYLERYSVYLEQLDAAGRSPVLADGVPVGVVVKGAVRQPTSYHARAGVRLLDVISLAGGPQDEAAEKVTVVRNVAKKTQPTVIRINLERAKRGADPNIFLMPDDEILVHTAEIVKLPLEATIRLDDAFVLPPNLAIQGETVILLLNDKPITVEQFMGLGWGTLEAATELSDTDRRRVVNEAIISGLPEFVFQELILQHFGAAVPDLNKNLSHEQRETANRNFGEALQQLPRPTDSLVQARYLVVILAKESAANTLSRHQEVNGFVRGWQPNTVASNKSAVVRHVQELVTTARLRSVVSLDYTKTTLIEVLRSVEQVHGLTIKVNSLHDQISQRIFDRPPAVDFHSENKSLGDSLTAIFHPYGLTLHQEGDEVVLQFADSKQAMEKFHSLPGPPSFGVFGVLRNPGWHPLDQEILLMDALAIAGGVENADGVSIEITNPDILSGKAIPVSMSLQALQRDTSGRLNRVIKDGDMITVTRSGSAVDGTAKISRAGSSGDEVVTGVDRRAVITLTGTGLIVETDSLLKDAEKSNGNVVSVNGKFPGAVRDMPESKVDSPEARFVLCAYPVADLVVNRKAVIATASKSSDANDPAQQPVNAAESAEKSGDRVGANSEAALPETKSISLNVKADFSPLTELIKATVQPDSWTSEGRGLIAVEEKSQTLVIKQTQTAHDEIATLLSQLRNDQNANVRIQCQIVRLTNDSQITWLDKQCSLHPLSPGSQWALLPQQRSEVFGQALLEQKPEVLSVPTVMTISGQSATIQIGHMRSPETKVVHGIRLEVNPQLVHDSKIIRLQHAVQIGKLTEDILNPIESLVGSGQTLVLLVNAPEEKDKATAEHSHYLLMLTPEHVPLKEEEEEVLSPQPAGDANGTR